MDSSVSFSGGVFDHECPSINSVSEEVIRDTFDDNWEDNEEGDSVGDEDLFFFVDSVRFSSSEVFSVRCSEASDFVEESDMPNYLSNNHHNCRKEEEHNHFDSWKRQ